MMKYFLIVVVIGCLIACGTKQQKPVDANEAYYESIKSMTGAEFDERFNNNDSAHFILYDNPDGDPKRYTRFYKEFGTKDTAMLQILAAGYNKTFIRVEKIMPCRSEGKIHFFEKGNPKQTLYFSNRGDSCNHLYFIKDGWFYYMDMDSATSELLKDLRGLVKKPDGDTVTDN
jgi:hypothetical protein